MDRNRPSDVGGPGDVAHRRSIFSFVHREKRMERRFHWFYDRCFCIALSNYELCQVLANEKGRRKEMKIVFFDRDGVINKFPGFGFRSARSALDQVGRSARARTRRCTRAETQTAAILLPQMTVEVLIDKFFGTSILSMHTTSSGISVSTGPLH